MLESAIVRIRSHWPKVRILIRGDGHYCAPEVLNLLRRLDCDYILGLPGNATLAALAKPWLEQCEMHWAPRRPPSCAASISSSMGRAPGPARRP